ncbi:MAG: MFS transporter [Candidatus Rokubacteria bacterium]|nr:MFS transporter [Candidatus Rokubacteria bacterium]
MSIADGRAAPGRRRATILALILGAQTVANIGPLGIPAIASVIRADLGLTLAQAGSFLSAYYVGPVVMSIPAGTLADRWGILVVLVAGQFLIAGGLAAASGSATYPTLIVLMMVAGCGYGMLNPTSTKAVLAWSPPAHRATLVGLKQVGLPFGGALGAALLPVLAVAVSWRAAVLASAVVIALGGAVSWLVYRDPPWLSAAGRPRARGGIRAVFLTRDLWLVAVATGVFAAMQTVWMAFFALYLQEVVGLPLLSAGRYLALAQASGMVGRVAFGLLSDRVFGGRRRIALAIAGSGSALCSLLIAVTGAGAPAWWLVLLAIAFGFVGIGWNGVQHTLMAELAGPEAAGTAVGLGLAVSSGGVALAPPVFGWSVEVAGGFTAPWIALALAMIVGLVMLIPVRERRRPI